MTAYAISADNVPPPIPLKVDDYFAGGKVEPMDKDALIKKLMNGLDEYKKYGKMGKIIVTGHADKQDTNEKDQIIFKKQKKGIIKRETLFKDRGSNFDYSYLRARVVRNYLDSLNKEIKWPYLLDVKIIISAAGSQLLSNKTDPLAQENRRIEISFER